MPTLTWRRYALRCLHLWHLSSLDAPTVALVWALVLARQADVVLPLPQAAILLLGTWIIYVLDRVLDGSRRSPPSALQARHHFHLRHRRPLLLLSLIAGVGIALLSCLLPARVLTIYLALGVPVALYATAIHTRWLGLLSRAMRLPQLVAILQPFASRPGPLAARRLDPHHRLPMRKEAAVAILFTAAVAAPTLAAVPPAGWPALALALLLLTPLCWLNCMLISHAESPAPSHRRLPLAGCAIALAFAAALVCAVGVAGSHTLPLTAAAVLLSSLLLLGLLFGHAAGVHPHRVRILADIALLTPLLLLGRPF